jgi:uncharacterized membrane protein YkvA (DUF1232 family)
VAEKRPPAKRPWWVRFTLWGLPNRAWAMAFVWFSLALALAAALYGRRDPRFPPLAALMVAAAVGYVLAIRWVDTHGGWAP